MENGLYQFYETFSRFLREQYAEKLLNAEHEDIQALTMEQLKLPLKIFLYCIALH